MSDRALRVAVVLSGRGTNFEAIADEADAKRIAVDIVAAISDRANARGLERARKRGIPAECIEADNRADVNARLKETLSRYAPDLVVLAGFMRVIDDNIVRDFAGRMLNVHPSLLPKYRGLNTYKRALEAGDEFHGTTIHFVTPELDAGPAVIQGRIRVLPGDDVASLSARVQSFEHILYPRVIGWFADGRLRLEDGTVRLDGRVLTGPIEIDGDRTCSDPDKITLR